MRTIGILFVSYQLIVGVLTKADTVQEGEHDPWIDVLTGKSHPLLLGYYATRLPSQKEIEQIWETSRRKERNFFQSKEPWNKVPNKERLGTDKLIGALSARLSQMIQNMFAATISVLTLDFLL